MTDQPAQEPTMEEILASIRRIISEDDAPAETVAEAAPEPAPEPTPVAAAPAPVVAAPEPVAPEPEPVHEVEDVLELTDRYEAPALSTIGDLDVAEVAPATEPEPAPVVAHTPAPAPVPAYDALVGESASASAASAFAGLATTFATPDPLAASGVGQTVDDLARQLLRPMLKEWLDANLQTIVEKAVTKEVERIARSAN